jgi:hypothetical protein
VSPTFRQLRCRGIREFSGCADHVKPFTTDTQRERKSANDAVAVGPFSKSARRCAPFFGGSGRNRPPASHPCIYDPENRLVTADEVAYTYDRDGKRMKKSNETLY